MDEESLAKGIAMSIAGGGAAQLTKEAVAAAARQFSRLLGRTGRSGEAVVSEIERRSLDDLGVWADIVRRGVAAELFVRFFARFQRIKEEKGISDAEVPPKILFPILAEATQQSDEALQEMWAGLLASAADISSGAPILFYTNLLKQLDPVEARLLDQLYLNLGIDWSDVGEAKPNTIRASELA